MLGTRPSNRSAHHHGSGIDVLYSDPPPGATPLELEDEDGLRPTWIATRGDLDQAEADNILKATMWAARRRWSVASLLTVESLRDLHRRMFGEVWSWAGDLRQRDTHIGVDWHQVRIEAHNLCLDVQVQAADKSARALSADEIAVRFHHRLVAVHLFPNGNGRHSRLAADILAVTLGQPIFTWGKASLDRDNQTRQSYLDALRTADRDHVYEPLLTFARS